MITRMYKKSDNQCMIEFVNGNVCQIQISQEDFERIYFYRFVQYYIMLQIKIAKMTREDIDSYTKGCYQS